MPSLQSECSVVISRMPTDKGHGWHLCVLIRILFLRAGMGKEGSDLLAAARAFLDCLEGSVTLSRAQGAQL